MEEATSGKHVVARARHTRKMRHMRVKGEAGRYPHLDAAHSVGTWRGMSALKRSTHMAEQNQRQPMTLIEPHTSTPAHLPVAMACSSWGCVSSNV